MLSLQHQSQVGHGLVPNGQEEGGHRGDVSLSEDHLQRQLHHEQIYGSAQGSTGVDNSHVHSGEEEVPLGNSTLHGYPEGLHQFAYPAHMSTTDAPLQHYPYMGLGSLQLAQMGSILQGHQYALLPNSEDAVYVNQKQYHRILKRRQARMKLENKFKVVPRKEWLHDSRHQHAKNRLRGPGGRFLSKEERAKFGNGEIEMTKEEKEEYSSSPGTDVRSPLHGS